MVIHAIGGNKGAQKGDYTGPKVQFEIGVSGRPHISR